MHRYVSAGAVNQSANRTIAQTRSAQIAPDAAKSRELEFLMEAHNGLSARIVREAGFKGIWASGSVDFRAVRRARQQ